MNRPGARIEMICPVAPIRKRHVIVDADEIYVRVRPERIKVKQLVRRPDRLISMILGPIRRVADPAFRPEDRPAIGGELDQRRDRGKRPLQPANLCHRAHLGTYAKRGDATCRGTQMGLMQNESPHRPFIWSGVRYAVAFNGKILWRGGTEERGDLGIGRGRSIRAAFDVGASDVVSRPRHGKGG